MKLENLSISDNELWQLTLKRNGIAGSKRDFRSSCPKCDGSITNKRDTKFSIDLASPRFKCFKCNLSASGYPAAVLLQAHINDPLVDYDELFKSDKEITPLGEEILAEILETTVDELTGNTFSVPEVEFQKIEIVENNPINIDSMNKVYGMLYESILEYSNDFMLQDLYKRGLDDIDIEKYGYRSALIKGDIMDIPRKFGHIDGVPGFYWDGPDFKSKLKIKQNQYQKANSYICPIRDLFRNELNPQVRYKDASCKYAFLSSTDKPNGCKAKAYTHFVGPIEPIAIVTEGPTKANVINKYLNRPVFAVPGVLSVQNFIDQLLEARKQGIVFKKIIIAFDMDKNEKKEISDAIISLSRKLIGIHQPIQEFSWDSNYKGLDDYLHHLNETGELKEYIKDHIDPLFYL